ncbi:MAG: flagellin [Myxococcota bacterium]
MPNYISNVSALSFVQQHGKITPALNKSIQKISTGLRVPNAATDSAAMAIFKKLEAEDVSFQQALRNTNDGVSMVQTAEGTLDSASQLVTRMRELSVQASNGTYSQEDRDVLNTEFSQLRDEFDRITGSAEFNDVPLFTGTGGNVDIQVGGDADPTNQIGIDLTNAMDSTSLGFDGASIDSQAGASSAVSDLDAALDAINTRRSDLGATQNRLLSSYDNVSTYSENLSATQSNLVDLDYALESSVNSQFLLRQKALQATQIQAKKMSQTAMAFISG